MNAHAQPRSEGPLRTLGVAAAVCLTCSVLVSASVQLLRPRQEANRERERQRHVMAIIERQPALADMLTALEEVDVRARIIELATGVHADWVDPGAFDVRRAERDPLTRVELSPERDPARIGARAKYATVYEVWRGDELQLVILPVYGAGYAGTIRGHLAVAPDGVRGGVAS